MFTGIIKELGKVYKFDRIGNNYRLGIKSKDIIKDVNIGDSVSVNGICLTVVEKEKDTFFFDVMEETIRKSSFSVLKKIDPVNLEGSLKAGEPLGGHFVLGHVDCVGRIKDIEKKGDNAFIDIEIPKEFIGLIVQKGSVAIDGISLTVGEARNNIFRVYIIPHTWKATNLALKEKGDKLNVEFDILGKYIIKIQESRGNTAITEKFLRDKGFTL